MSATNRGAIRSEKDYYATPLPTIRDFLKKFTELEPDFDLKTAFVLDPCAGGDAQSDMPYPLVLSEMGCENVSTLDIRSDSRAEFKTDYLSTECAPCDAIFSNPPYGLNQHFIEKAFRDTRDGGFIAYLLRINYYGTITRRSFWQSNMPKYTIVHSKRPSFFNRATDATEYAHFVWQKGYYPDYSKLIVI